MAAKSTPPDVVVEWIELDEDEGSGAENPWNWDFCLYAYVDDASNEILYIGKCYSTTVRQRYFAQDKDKLFDFFAAERDLTEENIHIIAGELESELKYDDDLLSSVEPVTENS